MATDRAFMDYVAEQAQLGERLSHRKMFGEYALYVDGKVVALVCDDSVFVKPTGATAAFPGLPERPPYPGAKPHPVADELLDDADSFRSLLLRTADALPPPRPPKPRKPRRKPGA